VEVTDALNYHDSVSGYWQFSSHCPRTPSPRLPKPSELLDSVFVLPVHPEFQDKLLCKSHLDTLARDVI